VLIFSTIFFARKFAFNFLCASSLVLALIGLVKADAPYFIGDSVKIETQQNYPDYDFYFVTLKRLVTKLDPKSPNYHVSRPEGMENDPSTFKFERIVLTPENSFTRSLDRCNRVRFNHRERFGEAWFLVAVRKDAVNQITKTGSLEDALRQAVLENKVGGIKVSNISTGFSPESNKELSSKVIVNTVVKLDDAELKLQERIEKPLEKSSDSTIIGGLLLAMCAVVIGLLFVKRSFPARS
jgi:hypothetical protein